MSKRVLNLVTSRAGRLDRARGERDAAILAAWSSGLSQNQIAKAAGLSRAGVQRILERNGARA